jgi:hypothetical protein
MRILLHRAYSSSDPQDATYHQRQGILRNSSSPADAIYLFICLSWSNRHSKNRLRSLLAATIAVLSIAAFTVAGDFSSQTSTSVGTEVLLEGNKCGIFSSNVPGALLDRALPYSGKILEDAANYAQQCYSDG